MQYRRPCPECDAETVQTPDVDREAGIDEAVCEDCGSMVDEFELES